MPNDFYVPTILTEVRKELVRAKWCKWKELRSMSSYHTFKEFYRMRRSQINRIDREAKDESISEANR